MQSGDSRDMVRVIRAATAHACASGLIHVLDVMARRPRCVYLSTENDAVQLRKEAPGPYVLYIIIDFYFVTHQTIAERASVHSCHAVLPSSAGRSPKLDHHFVAVSCSVLADAENIRTCKISEALKRHLLVCVPIYRY